MIRFVNTRLHRRKSAKVTHFFRGDFFAITRAHAQLFCQKSAKVASICIWLRKYEIISYNSHFYHMRVFFVIGCINTIIKSSSKIRTFSLLIFLKCAFFPIGCVTTELFQLKSAKIAHFSRLTF